MLNKIKYRILGLALMLTPYIASAQRNPDAGGLKQLSFYQDSLKKLVHVFATNENDLERKNANYAFIKTLVTALKTPASYAYPFDSLTNVSVVNAPDNRFRLFTWHITNNDGSCRFYGAIQMNTGGALKLYPLEDYSPLQINPEDSVSDNHKWYGAQYYKIIQPDVASPYYTLLGWKGNNIQSTKKVIEVLSFANGTPQLGMPVFDGNGRTRKRVVFEFSRQASMMLKYVPERKLIIFDHLSPVDARAKGKPESYGPDMTYAGYQYKQDRWIYTDNLDMRNMPTLQDDRLVDPKAKQ